MTYESVISLHIDFADKISNIHKNEKGGLRLNMNLDEYKKIIEYRTLGVTYDKIAEIMGLKYWDIRKVAKLSLEEFNALQDKEGNKLDKYANYILDIIKKTPTIKDSNIYYKLREDFPEFTASEPTFYRYVKALRKEYGYDRFKKKGTSIRSEAIPGEEAQVDFGQYKIKDMYGINRRIYFFVMVMRYSQLKFVYFSSVPFTSQTAVNAHKLAFSFFGGIPKIVLYDQDRVFCVHENYGNIILAEDFDKYVKDMGMTVVFCAGYNPESKGLVENCVRIVKENFLEGRVYKGIDSLNSACLEWLDNYANNHIVTKKEKTSHELFLEEAKLLRKVPKSLQTEFEYYTVYRNAIQYKYGIYEMPLGYDGEEVKVESDGANVTFKNKDTGEIIVVHPIASAKWQRRTIDKSDPVGADEQIIKNLFKENETFDKFLSQLKEYMPRYYLKSCVKIKALTNYYSTEELDKAFNHCVIHEKCTVNELAGYLIYRYGKEKADNAFSGKPYAAYKRRAKELKEELHG